jgi:hypothetical protein
MKKMQMKPQILCRLVLILFLVNTLSISLVFGASQISIGEKKPKNNGLVETMNLILRVEVLRNEEPLGNAWVHFYIDGERIGVEFTELDGVAVFHVNKMIELGYHNWRVRVNRQPYDSYWSPVWRFNYQPRPVLTLYSKYGETFGERSYTYGKLVSFEVEEPIISLGEGKRLLFTGWTSYQENGYTGLDAEGSVLMLEDIREIASWETQYFLNMSSDLPKHVYPKSGWYDEGDNQGIYVEPPYGTEFLYWIGSGNYSYSGEDVYHTIEMNGPIMEEAVFMREEYVLSVMSEFGDPLGDGVYPAWENASFGVEDRYLYTDQGVRLVLTGWSSDSQFGYDGNSTMYQVEVAEDIVETAIWELQYYIHIDSTEGGNVTTESGWVNENTEVILNAITLEGYTFMGWIGVGEVSYTGLESNYSLVVASPVNETAKWRKQYRVEVDSVLSADGAGVYLDGDSVTLEAKKSDGLIVRTMFKKWSGDVDSTNNPFTFNIHRDMYVSAQYDKDYTLFLGIFVVVIGVVGVFFLRLLRS